MGRGEVLVGCTRKEIEIEKQKKEKERKRVRYEEKVSK